MSIDGKSLGIGIAIGITLPFVCVLIAFAVSKLIEKIRDTIADRKLGLIKENEKLVIDNYKLRTKIKELEASDGNNE